MVLGKQPVSLFSIPFSELHDNLRQVGGFTLLGHRCAEEQPRNFRLGAELFGERKLKIGLILRSESGALKQAGRNRSVTKFQVVVVRLQVSDRFCGRVENAGNAHHVLV